LNFVILRLLQVIKQNQRPLLRVFRPSGSYCGASRWNLLPLDAAKGARSHESNEAFTRFLSTTAFDGSEADDVLVIVWVKRFVR
jgi:hypothetical protein